MSNTVHPQRGAIEDAIARHLATHPKPLQKLPRDAIFRIDWKVPGRIAGVSNGRNVTVKDRASRAKVVVITAQNGHQRNAVGIQNNLAKLRSASACVVLNHDENTVQRANVHIKGRIVDVEPVGPKYPFVSLVTDHP